MAGRINTNLMLVKTALRKRKIVDWGNTDILEIMDRIHEEIAELTGLLENHYTLTLIPGTATYAPPDIGTIPNNYVVDKLKAIQQPLLWKNGIDIITSRDVFERYRRELISSTGRVTMAMIWEGKVEFLPIPDSADVLTVYVITRPLAAKEGTGDPPFDSHYDMIIRHGVLGTILDLDGNDEGKKFLIQYDQELREHASIDAARQNISPVLHDHSSRRLGF